MLKINKNIQRIISVANKQEFHDYMRSQLKKNPKHLDVRNIHFNESLTDMDFQFMECKAEEIDVTGWNTENFTTVAFMFANCSNLKKVIGLETWDVHNVRQFDKMFMNCSELEDIGDITKWDFRSNASFSKIFNGCDKFFETEEYIKIIEIIHRMTQK